MNPTGTPVANPASTCATRLTIWATLFQPITGEDAPAPEQRLFVGMKDEG